MGITSSRYASSAGNSSGGGGFTNTTTNTGYIPSTSQGTQSSSSFGSNESQSTSESFSGISNPEALASLLNYIKNAQGGGSESYKAQLAARQGILGNVQQLAGSYTTDAAFRDAALLMQQNLQQSMDKNMPAISKAITGAGTSASSMQGLLSQKLALESAQAAGALGAEQAKAYGGISAQLAAVLDSLSKINTEGETNFLKALELAKTSTAKSQSTSSGYQTSYSQGQQSSTGASPGTQTTTQNSGGSSGNSSGNTSSYNSSGYSSGDDATVPNPSSAYVYIPYDLTNPGFVNPYSSIANQQSAANFNGYYWD